MSPYTETIQKMRLFEESDSVREWDRRLRHLYVDFSRFFPNSDWPLALHRWAARGDLLSQQTPSPAAFEIFNSQLRLHWLTFLMFSEKEWRRWRAKITYLVFLTQAFEKDILKKKRKELIDVQTCFDRSLHYTSFCVVDLLSKTLSADIKRTKHDSLYSSYPEILERLSTRLGSSLVEFTKQKMKMDVPAIYMDLLDDAEPISNPGFLDAPNPQSWIGRPRAMTQGGPRRPPMLLSRSTNRVPLLRRQEDLRNRTDADEP